MPLTFYTRSLKCLTDVKRFSSAKYDDLIFTTSSLSYVNNFFVRKKRKTLAIANERRKPFAKAFKNTLLAVYLAPVVMREQEKPS